MNEDETERRFHTQRKAGRTYISRPRRGGGGHMRYRYVRRVVDATAPAEFRSVADETVLKESAERRYQLRAIVTENDRQVRLLHIEWWDVQLNSPRLSPQTVRVTLNPEQAAAFERALKCVREVDLPDGNGVRVDDSLPSAASNAELGRRLSADPELLEAVLRENLTTKDVVSLGYRKAQLEAFRLMLEDNAYFQRQKTSSKMRDEDVWQRFFERNAWIFGYGLDFIFRSGLEGAKLEQVVSGHQFESSGKRIDALLKTRGRISSLCFVEMKTHQTKLLRSLQTPPRPECWPVSLELMEAVAQVQKTVYKATRDIHERTEIANKDTGVPTGETVFLCAPKSILIIGSLSEFQEDHGVNLQHFTSFELFRRNCAGPEIITFDELYERARFIVDHSEEMACEEMLQPENQANGLGLAPDFEDPNDEVPF